MAVRQGQEYEIAGSDPQAPQPACECVAALERSEPGWWRRGRRGAQIAERLRAGRRGSWILVAANMRDFYRPSCGPGLGAGR
ncbi:hypothetical protein [Streptomyces silvisoli]|uniref:Uncharacterized protein n=1 Tax=Streptomyces silvisoli TaxID=3034235 RepID=A0ABT5ZDC6_9ACTN|nr:hypothetical protein [Streptomyces silvisoli]MDF3287818.1 hypothetical protein [Streptomyces silvisoli]